MKDNYKKTKKDAKKAEKMLNSPVTNKIAADMKAIIDKHEQHIFMNGNGAFSQQALNPYHNQAGSASHVSQNAWNNWKQQTHMQNQYDNMLSSQILKEKIDAAIDAAPSLETVLREYQSFEDMVKEVAGDVN